jgi:UPF0755 protein
LEKSHLLKAGEYKIPAGSSMHQVVNILVEGKVVIHRLTVAEGLLVREVMALVEERQDLRGALPAAPKQGTLLPETYHFTLGETRARLIERMQQDMQATLQKLWADRDPDLPIKTPAEAVILASIVEKETGKADERPRVASVFINRLRKSMRLQSDPTIIYGIAGGKGTLGRPILQSELDRKTDYNTYQIDGLPPTPIANPGIAALEATANPSRTNDLYFVASGDGGHVFAATLSEHNENVARWRKIAAEMRRQAKEAEKEAVATPPETPPTPPLRLDLKKTN